MLARVVEICRDHARGEQRAGALVIPEAKRNPYASAPEDQISKVFRLHRDPAFETFARDPALIALLAEILGDDIDVFLSQFIFKNPGARGQPWHQDSLYFPFEPPRQVGVWLAVKAFWRSTFRRLPDVRNVSVYTLRSTHSAASAMKIP